MSFFSKIITSLSAKNTGGTSNRTVGIDIGSSSIKVVEVEETNGLLTLTTYGELQLGPYAGKEIGESVILDAKKEQQALIDVLRESAAKAKKAVFAVPLSTSFVTVMSLEVDKSSELSSRVHVEARKYIPTQISDVTLDWTEIEGSKHQGKQDVLVAAIQNNSLQRFDALLSFIGFVKPPNEIECFSVIRSVRNEADEHVAIIDIGALSTKLYITKAGALHRMHRVRAGGALASKRIAEITQLSYGDAENLKRTIVTTDPRYGDVLKAHQSCYERSFTEFRQVMDEYEQALGAKIGVVYVTGGGALFAPVQTELKDILQKEIVVAEPFSKVAYPAFMEDILRDIGPTFTVALGAALRAGE